MKKREKDEKYLRKQVKEKADESEEEDQRLHVNQK